MSPADNALAFYEAKLLYECDPADLAADLAAGVDIAVIDARSPDAYAREHIPGAVNLPHACMSRQATASIPRDRLVVVYCDGIGCNASTKGARNLTRLGFRVKELQGGLDWWKRDGHRTEGTAVIRTAGGAGAPLDTDGCGCGLPAVAPLRRPSRIDCAWLPPDREPTLGWRM